MANWVYTVLILGVFGAGFLWGMNYAYWQEIKTARRNRGKIQPWN